MVDNLKHPDSFKDEDEPRSSQTVLDALRHAEKEFGGYFEFCERIDKLLDACSDIAAGKSNYLSDQEFDLFWSSLEIIKPAVYSRPPVPVVAPRFADRDKIATTASEVLERCLVSSFERGDFDQVMLGVRDDLVIAARGVPRVTYESDSKGKRVCDEHMDRRDFLHEPARKWSEVGWVAFAGYLTEREFKKRFAKWSDRNKGHQSPQFNVRRDKDDRSQVDTAAKCKVWEVWHRADDRVYWVTEGVDTFLDESAPFLDLESFYPCPRPAYGVLKRRSLIPVPDYVRYEKTLEQVNELTRRIHSLLEWVRVKGLIPAGGDVGQAVETALTQTSDDVILIPVPAAGLMTGAGQFVQFLPLQEFAATITGLIEARRELIQNFYELSGISDIMRGATEAEETLGAQQLKSQYGSVRVREKIDELQRVARDMARLTAEIIAEKFDKDTILSMSQMNLPSRKEVEKKRTEVEDGAKRALEDLERKATEMVDQARSSGQPFDQEQARSQFEQQQQEIIAKSTADLQTVNAMVSIDDVMDLLRDQKARAFSIEIETDSTIMADEMSEKQARGEFLTAFSSASTAVTPLLQAGEAGAKLAGGLLKFSLAPFRVGRQLDGMIDDFVEAAPQIAASMAEDGDGDLAAAQNKLAEAEIQKAKAATMNVEARAANENQKLQAKMMEMQQKSAADHQKMQLEVAKAQQQASAAAEKAAVDLAAMEAKVNLMQAQTAEILNKIGLDVRKQDLEEYRAAEESQARAVDQTLAVEVAARDAELAQRGEARADRQQSFGEQQASRSEDRADRQQEFAERQPPRRS